MGGRVGRGFGEFENPREGFYTSKKILKYKNPGEGFSQGRVGRGFGQIWSKKKTRSLGEEEYCISTYKKLDELYKLV